MNLKVVNDNKKLTQRNPRILFSFDLIFKLKVIRGISRSEPSDQRSKIVERERYEGKKDKTCKQERKEERKKERKTRIKEKKERYNYPPASEASREVANLT